MNDQRKRVLIVDDDENVRKAVETILRYRGHDVTSASCGREGLDAVRNGFRGVVLMDIFMPGLNGWETIRAVVNEGLHSQILICMLTGTEAGSNGEGLEEFVFDYLPKPFKNAELIQMVENAAGFLD